MTDTWPGTEAELAVLLAEYAQLKEEQRSRIGFRDNFVYVNLAAVAAVGYAAFEQHVAQFLLLVPLTCFVLGWTYLSNDRMITQLGRYARENLAPRLTALSATDEVLGWEQEHSRDRRRAERKSIQLAVDLSAFCLPSAGVLVLLVRYGTTLGYDYSRWTWAMVCLAAVATLLLAWQFAVYSEVKRPRTASWLRPRRPGAKSLPS